MSNPGATSRWSGRRIACVGLSALACLGALGLGATASAQAATVCGGDVKTSAGTIDRTISCGEADVSRYFLISTDLKALSDAQRADVLQRPTYYTLAYMAAALANDIQADFKNPAVQSATYQGVIGVRGSTGANVDHPAFSLSLDRKTVQGIDWKAYPPMNLLALPGAQQTPWLRQSLAAESASK